MYIDGSKFEENANKYSWVWKKATERARYRLFDKITLLFQKINEELSYTRLNLMVNTEYTPDYLKEVIKHYAQIWQLDETQFVYGRGHHKTVQQRHYEQLKAYAGKLEEYVVKLRICGEERKSYSRTGQSATFMRIQSIRLQMQAMVPTTTTSSANRTEWKNT